MDEHEHVEHGVFVAAVRPFSELLQQLVATGYASRQQAGFTPGPDADAMAELEQQTTFAGVWDAAPIDTATSHVGLLLVAGEDAMRTYAHAVIADATPLYAHLPLARFGVEVLAMAAWLGEPRIGAKERMRRSINERIYSAIQQERLPEGLNPELGRRERLLAAVEAGFERTKAKRGQPAYLAPARPSITKLVVNALDDERLGRTVYSYLSAVSHGALWGLAPALLPPTDPTEDPGTGGLEHSSLGIGLYALALASAHITAWEGWRQHMGWESAGWLDAMAETRRLAKAVGDVRPEPSQRTQLSGLWLPR